MKKAWICGRLGYNSENDRYGLLVSDLWAHEGFRCGDFLQILVNNQWIDTTMEMTCIDGQDTWYLTGTEYRGKDLEYLDIRIQTE